MKLSIRRVLSFLLCAALVFSILPAAPAVAAADEPRFSNGSVSPNPYFKHGYADLQVSFTIPPELEGDRVYLYIRYEAEGSSYKTWADFSRPQYSDAQGNFSVGVKSYLMGDLRPVTYEVFASLTKLDGDWQYIGSFTVIDGPHVSDVSITPNPCMIYRDFESDTRLEMSFHMPGGQPEDLVYVEIYRDEQDDGEGWNATFYPLCGDEGNVYLTTDVFWERMPPGRYFVRASLREWGKWLDVGTFVVVDDSLFVRDVSITPDPCYLGSTDFVTVEAAITGKWDEPPEYCIFLCVAPNGDVREYGCFSNGYSWEKGAWIYSADISMDDLGSFMNYEEGQCSVKLQCWSKGDDQYESYEAYIGVINVKAAASAAKMLEFWAGNGWGYIDEDTGTVSVTAEYGRDLSALAPEFRVSYGAAVTVDGIPQVSGVSVQDFSAGPVRYLVTSKDGSASKEYAVTVVTAEPSNIARIWGFAFKDLPANTQLTVDLNRRIICAYVPRGTESMVFTPTFSLSSGATANLANGTPIDFTNSADKPVEITVTAQDGVTKTVYELVAARKEETPIYSGTVESFNGGVKTTPAGRTMSLAYRTSSTSFTTIATTTTDENGYYEFYAERIPGVQSMELHVIAQQLGEGIYSERGIPEPGRPYDSGYYASYPCLTPTPYEPTNFYMFEGEFTLRGSVVDAVTGKGLSDAVILSNRYDHRYQTDENGAILPNPISTFALWEIDLYSTYGITFTARRPGYVTGSPFRITIDGQMYEELKATGGFTIPLIKLTAIDAPYLEYDGNSSLSVNPSEAGRGKPVEVSVRVKSARDVIDGQFYIELTSGTEIVPGSVSVPGALISGNYLFLYHDFNAGEEFSFRFWIVAPESYTYYDYVAIVGRFGPRTSSNREIFGEATVRVVDLTLNDPGEVGILDGSTENFDIIGQASSIPGSRVAVTVTGPDSRPAVTSPDLSGRTPSIAGMWYKYYNVSILQPVEGVYTITARLLNANGEEIARVERKLNVRENALRILDITVTDGSNNAKAPAPVNNSSSATLTVFVDGNAYGPAVGVSTKLLSNYGVTGAYYTMHTAYGTYIVPAQWDPEVNRYVGYFPKYRMTGVASITLELWCGNEVTHFIVAWLTGLQDPSGYVYDKESGEYIAGAVATLQVLEDGVWTDWNAHDYAQHNDQVTDNLGRYGWFVPEGDYRVLVSADGYYDYDTLEDPAYGLITVLPPRDDINIGLTPMPGSAKITSVSVTTPTLVATLEANLNITVEGQNLEGKTLTAYLSAGGELLYPTPVTFTDGKWTARMHILKAPPHTAECAVVISVNGGPAQGNCTITLAEYKPTELWTPSVYADNAGGKVIVMFSDAIQPMAGGCSVKIGGQTYVCRQTDDKTLTIDITPGEIPAGTPIVISGVKYPILFPSYSFTFTVAMP